MADFDVKQLNQLISDALAENKAEPVKKEAPVRDDSLGKYCDHTVLRAYTTDETVKAFCAEAVKYNAASMCINPANVALAAEALKGTGVLPGATIGFPLGATTSKVKAFEAEEAIENGAEEIDMVINVGKLRGKDYEYVYNDIKGVVDVGKKHGKLVKVIIETCYLTRDEKIAACVIAKAAGTDYVKTSTGMGTGGATVEDVKLMKAVVGEGILVKASTGVNNRDDAKMFIAAGATRLGTSSTPQIVTGDNNITTVSKTNQPPQV